MPKVAPYERRNEMRTDGSYKFPRTREIYQRAVYLGYAPDECAGWEIENAAQYLGLSWDITPPPISTSPAQACRWHLQKVPAADIVLSSDMSSWRVGETQKAAVSVIKRTLRAWPSCGMGGTVTLTWDDNGKARWWCNC